MLLSSLNLCAQLCIKIYMVASKIEIQAPRLIRMGGVGTKI